MKLTLQRITIVLFITLTACAPSPELLAAQTATASTAIASQWTKTPTATLMPTLTHTPKPTATKTPRATPTLFPRKQILIEAGWRFGDGFPTDRIFFGPFFVLYTDGELLIMSQRDDRWYSQTTLTTSQICDLLLSIDRTGFFKLSGDGSERARDSIYKLPATPKPGEEVMGGGGWYITVNGKPAKRVFVYHPYQQYLVQQIKDAYSLLYNYKPIAEMKLYRAKHLSLLIMKSIGGFYSPAPNAPLTWPGNLPFPEEILDGNNDQRLIIDDKNVSPSLDVFATAPKQMLFTYSGVDYFINATPLLPHQPVDESVKYPQEFDLPFKCP